MYKDRNERNISLNGRPVCENDKFATFRSHCFVFMVFLKRRHSSERQTFNITKIPPTPPALFRERFPIHLRLLPSFTDAAHIVCGTYNSRVSVRLSVPSIDSSSGVRRVCCSARAPAAAIDRQLVRGERAQQRMRVATCSAPRDVAQH